MIPSAIGDDVSLPSITTQPQSVTVIQGGAASFSVVAAGENLSYQWWGNGTRVPGGTNAICTINNVQPLHAGNYAVVVSNGLGGVTSTVVALTVTDAPAVIVLQPQGQTVTRGSAVTFSVSVMGAHLGYQWWCNGVKLPNATNAYYSIANALDSHVGNYALVVSNGAGVTVSRVVALSVTAPAPGNTGQPIICVQPQSQAVPGGCAATLSATVSCDNPVFQWSFNGVPLPDGTNAFYALPSVRNEHAGDYQLVVSNSTGSVSSILAHLTVIDPNQIPPSISQIPSQWTNDQTPLGPLKFDTTGGTGSTDDLMIRATSSDRTLVSDEQIYIERFGPNQTVTLIPGPGRTGTCYITITVTDPAGISASTSFALTITAAPSLTVSTPIIAQPHEPFSYTLDLANSGLGISSQVSALLLPSWLSFDSQTLTLSGTPPAGGPEGDEVKLAVSNGTDPAVLKTFRIWTADGIALTNATDVTTKRQALIDYIWGADGWPTKRAPDSIAVGFESTIHSSLYNEAGNLARIDQYTVTMAYHLESKVYHFIPIHGNGRLFLFHAGHHPYGFFGDDVSMNALGTAPGLVIPALLKEGYAVLAFSMPIYNPDGAPTVELPGIGNQILESHESMLGLLDRPFRFFLEPLVVALNYAEDQYGYDTVYMTGLSGGGWTTTVYAALDPRVRRSFPVAGSVPNYLRVGYEGLGDAEQDEPGFYRIANYEELYVMGSHGENRAQLQILNRYDACCFYGLRFTNWVDKVASKVEQLGAGSYSFFLDETHHEHKTSRAALAAILDSLPPTLAEIPDQTVVGNTDRQTVPLMGVTTALFSRTNAISITADSDNPALLGNLAIDYTSPNPTGVLSFTPQPGGYGTATVTVTISDGHSTHSTYRRRFAVVVLPPPPMVELVTPTDGTTLESPQTIQITANASSSSGLIRTVEFWDATNLLGVVSSAPYSLLWTNPTVGTHILNAVATDDRGATNSDGVLLTVLPLNQAPTVQWVNPSTNSLLQNPQPTLIEVTASDSDGTIVAVEFRDGTNSLGVVSSPPYSLLLTNPTVGTYILSAVATDNRGATTTSDVALLTVLPLNQGPNVEWLSPANHSVLQNPQSVTLQVTPTDFDGTIARVEFREGTNTLGAVTSPPYSLLWTNPTAGTHTFTAVVTDNRGGVALSDLINVTITAPSTNETPLTIRSAQFVAFQASPPVTKSALDPGNSQFQFQIAGPDGSTVVVEASSDFRNWTAISTNTLVNGAAVTADADSLRFEIRHYRVRLSTQTP
jgi:hypothetical protein